MIKEGSDWRGTSLEHISSNIGGILIKGDGENTVKELCGAAIGNPIRHMDNSVLLKYIFHCTTGVLAKNATLAKIPQNIVCATDEISLCVAVGPATSIDGCCNHIFCNLVSNCAGADHLCLFAADETLHKLDVVVFFGSLEGVELLKLCVAQVTEKVLGMVGILYSMILSLLKEQLNWEPI